jgi:hypothetical protein
MERFIPTQVLEMDMMKFLLQDFKTLKRIVTEDIVSKFWIHQQNKALYTIMKNELSKQQDVNPYHFYVRVIKIAKVKIQDFDMNLYDEVYELGFDFSSTYLEYYQYFKCKQVEHIFRKLTFQFETKEFDFDEVFDEIEHAKLILSSMLKRKSAYNDSTFRNGKRAK